MEKMNLFLDRKRESGKRAILNPEGYHQWDCADAHRPRLSLIQRGLP